MNNGVSCGHFESDFEVSSDKCLCYSAENLVVLPCLSNSVLNELRNRNDSATHVLGEERSTFCVFAGLDILSKCLDIFLTVSDFLVSHFFDFLSLLDFLAFSACNGFGVLLSLLDFFLKSLFSLFDRI